MVHRRHFRVVAAIAALGGLGTAALASGPVAGPIVPSRIDVRTSRNVRAEALEALWRDGAVVLSNVDSHGGAEDFKRLAGQLPARLFAAGWGPDSVRLLSPDAPVNAVHEELKEAKRRGYHSPGSGLLPHTDGYAYGDDMPDFLFLVCEQSSARGGASALIDGQQILDALKATDEGRELVEWLSTAEVDLQETNVTGIINGREARGPVVQHIDTPQGRQRLKWRRQINLPEHKKLGNFQPLGPSAAGGEQEDCSLDLPGESYLSLWKPLPSASKAEAAEAERRLREFDQVLQNVTADAFLHHGFYLTRGEALVVDNYRVLHARTPYAPPDAVGTRRGAEPERKFWRVWSWTSEGSGLPPDGARSSNPLNDKVFSRNGNAATGEAAPAAAGRTAEAIEL
mmetsp:Transcript_15769/g.40667  ORF Transcript_15769/g.40667 Transcript_15769/m.40667 type:complete len:398 (-) Transcript_15769:22-1215(-)